MLQSFRQTILPVVLLCCLVGSGGTAAAGRFIVKGTVLDRSDKAPLEGVTVVSSFGHTAVTDFRGRFIIRTGEWGVMELTFSLPGFVIASERFMAKPEAAVESVIELDQAPVYRDEVLVEEAAVPEVEPVEFVTPDYVVNAPGAFEDTLQSLQIMPGVVGGDDYTARLFIRGSRPDQNGMFLDNIPIYDPYRLFGLTSLFNPETIHHVKLIPGGFDVRYGDRLSAVIEVDNRHGCLADRFTGSANLSLTTTNLIAEGRLFETFPSSWLLSARRTYYDLAIKAADNDASSYPSFTDFQCLTYFQPAPRHEWFVTLMACDEGTDISEDEDVDEDPDHVDLVDDQKNYVAGVNGSHLLGTATRLRYVASFTRNRQVSDTFFREGETSYVTRFDQDLTSSNYRLGGMFEWHTYRHSVHAGLEAARSDNEVRFNLATDDPRADIPDDLLHFGESQDYGKFGWYAQDTWEFIHGLELKGGMRWDLSTLSDMSAWSPRVSMRWQLEDGWSMRAAWGYYYQFPGYDSLQGDGYFLDLRGIKDLHLKPERAVHYVLSAEYENRGGWGIEFDVYYKDLDDLIDSGVAEETILVLDESGAAVPYTRDSLTWDPENSRHGFARGLDMTVTINDTKTRPWYGMFTYTYCEARSRRADEPYLWESWDRRHCATWIAGWKLNPRWELGWKWRFGTGFPYTPLTNVIRVVDDLDGDGRYEPDEGETFTYQRDDPDEVIRSERYPAYHRLDFRVQYSRRYRHLDVMYYLDIINLYARKNIQSYDYNADFSEREEEEGMPFLPSFGIKIRL
ncbi:TonB-dependent receptor [bacterium]|nr:TonB-dependent receptor [candidate division CSSED10-310 bacterium]